MGVQVTFDPNAFLAQFTEFNYLTPAAVTGWNGIAQQYCRNDGLGPVESATTQTALLNLMTAHIIKLFAPQSNGTANPGLVGRISSASEGSVSVSAEYMPATPGSAWYNQTSYGAAFYQLTKPYRSALLVRGPRRSFEPWPGIGGIAGNRGVF